MKLEILLLGKTKESYLQQGIDDFFARLGKYNPVKLIDIKSLLQNSDQICRSDDEFDDKKGRNILK